MKIRRMCKEAHQTAVEKGWWDNPRSVPELLCLVHSELSEALEDHRKDPLLDKTIDFVYGDGEEPKPVGFPIEIADAFIRLGDLCEYYGIDIEAAIKIKMAYNKTRPHRHGGKAC